MQVGINVNNKKWKTSWKKMEKIVVQFCTKVKRLIEKIFSFMSIVLTLRAKAARLHRLRLFPRRKASVSSMGKSG